MSTTKEIIIQAKTPPFEEVLKIKYVPLSSLRHPEKNPRTWTKSATEELKESIHRYGVIDPLIVNCAPGREGIIIGGNFRASVLREMGIKIVPVVYINIPDPAKEAELIIRLNKNTGEFDLSLLAEFDESLLKDIGFTSEELDDIFAIPDQPENFDLEKELRKLNINNIEMQKGDLWRLGDHRLFIGDSTVKADVLKLMGGEKADMCLTDPPYILDYLRGKRKGDPTTGFGAKRNRRYLETDELPPNFTERWMANVKEVANENFSIIVYENWKNIKIIWDAMQQHWHVKNMIVWHLANRHQGFSSKYKFFSKHDIAMVGASGTVPYNLDPEEGSLQEEYETALFAISGKPQWESYEHGKKICPTDFIDFRASDEKHSGQGVVFGTKPVEILIPYMKVLTKRGDIVIEPFGGSGSTLITAEKLKRRCFLMEKSPVYASVIRARWQKITGGKAEKIESL